MLPPWFGVQGYGSMYGYMGWTAVWVTSQDWKEAANVRGAMVGINVSLVYDLQYEYRAKPLRGLLP